MPLQGTDAVYQGLSEAENKRSHIDQDAARAHENGLLDEKKQFDSNSGDVTIVQEPSAYSPDYPTEHQRATLRRMPGKISLLIFTVAFIEFAERFSYYGSTVVLTNFVQQPLPEGSTTGAISGIPGATVPGALGKGQQAAFALTTFNTFWIYITPLLGAYMADAVWGRFKTICVAIAVAIVGHVILIVCAVPSVIHRTSTSYGLLWFAIIVMGTGTGAFKSNISPLIAEQQPNSQLRVVTTKSGEQVIEDPALTTSRIMLYFYLLINAGSLSGQISMVFAEERIGFWLSYLVPTLVFCLTPFVMWWGNSRYNKTKPNGSILAQAFHVIRYATSQCRASNPFTTIRNMTRDGFWDRAKPSVVEANNPEGKPRWMTFDDLWVDELRRGIKACYVFILYPFFWLCYNQITSNLTSQAATMTRNGVPNDLINNLNPISLVIMIPIMDRVIYPAIRKAGYNFTAIKRITVGFWLASLAMVSAAVTQHYIYQTSPCGTQAATCDEVSPLNVWIQTPTYVIIGISEIFASITGLEYAFTKAPQNMRSLVTAVYLATQSVSAAIAQAFTPLSQDPHLVVMYSTFSGLSFVAGTAFWFIFRKLDSEEQKLNDMRRQEDYDKKQPSAPGM